MSMQIGSFLGTGSLCIGMCALNKINLRNRFTLFVIKPLNNWSL